MIGSDRIPSHLDEQRLERVGVIFLRSKPDQFLEGNADRHAFPVRTIVGHGVEGVGQSDDAHGLRDFVRVQPIGISGPVSAFVMPADDLRNLRPGELHLADDLMPNDRVVAASRGILSASSLRGFSEQPLVDGDHADIVQISSRAQ